MRRVNAAKSREGLGETTEHGVDWREAGIPLQQGGGRIVATSDAAEGRQIMCVSLAMNRSSCREVLDCGRPLPLSDALDH